MSFRLIRIVNFLKYFHRSFVRFSSNFFDDEKRGKLIRINRLSEGAECVIVYFSTDYPISSSIDTLYKKILNNSCYAL